MSEPTTPPAIRQLADVPSALRASVGMGTRDRLPRPPVVIWLRRLSWVLMGSAVLVLGYVGLLIGYQGYEQHRLSSDWERDHPSASIGEGTPAFTGATGLTGSITHAHVADGQPMSKLALDSIGFSAIVLEGADRGILSSGPGHDDRTGYPGEGRLVVIGNHNGFSMSWNDIKPGDEVTVEMPYGRYHYRVTRRSIVDGDDTTVIGRPRDGEALVLSTCWPLWAGALAHQRLVVEATPVQAAR